MVQAIEQEVVVKKNNVLEVKIHSPKLKLGRHVKVILFIEENEKTSPHKKHAFRDLIGKGKGERCFSTAKEVDEFIREERNKWKE